MSDVDEDDDVGVSQSVSRNNRGTKGVTEFYYFVLALSLNEITVNNESISSEQQYELMTQNCDRWIELPLNGYKQDTVKILPSFFIVKFYRVHELWPQAASKNTIKTVDKKIQIISCNGLGA
jgi:hypothetical protein